MAQATALQITYQPFDFFVSWDCSSVKQTVGTINPNDNTQATAPGTADGDRMTEIMNHRIGYLDIAHDDRVAIITMERREKLNAMTAAFWKDLRDALDMLADKTAVRAVIITGGGDRAFSAGGDIAGFLNLESIDDMRAYQVDAMAGFAHVERTPLIVIAAINGLAYGGGCELALACDIVITADDATFSMPEAALGLVPGFGAVRGPELLGRQMAKFMITTGDAIDAQRALAVGLAQMVVPADRLMAEARAVAERIASRSPNALHVAKRMINRTIDDAHLDYSVDEITALQASKDRATGIEAFLARRAPVFGTREEGAKHDG